MAEDTKQQSRQSDILSLYAEVFPRAGAYYLALLYHYGNFETQLALKEAADALKRDLSLPEDLNADELLISVLIMRVSKKAALRHIEVLKSQKAIEEISQSLGLDAEYRILLLNHYGSLASETLFIKEYENNCDIDCNPSKIYQDANFPKIIDTLIDNAQKKEARCAHLWQDNHDYLYAMSKAKVVPQGLYYDLLNLYGKKGCSSFEAPYESLLQKFNALSKDDKLNKILAALVMLYSITEEDAFNMIKVAHAVKYPLLAEDLQIITLKYLPFKTEAEIAQTLEAILKRLPFSETPAENFGLAVKVMTAASAEAYLGVEGEAKERVAKTDFMKQLSANRFFKGFEDEITLRFYPANNFEEVTNFFNRILRELPYNTNPEENADIALKILLKKLPPKDGLMQASFRKENKAQKSADSLEQEALGLYLGTKNKDEVLLFFREKLAGYTFWKEDASKHGCALNIMVEELNGKITTGNADLALSLLQAGYPEESAELISKSLPSSSLTSAEEIIKNYERFYKSSQDHKDAARRVVNMMQ